MKALLFLLFVLSALTMPAQYQEPAIGSTKSLDKLPSLVRSVQYAKDSTGNIMAVSSIKTKEIKPYRLTGEDAWIIIQTYHSPRGVDKDSSIISMKNGLPLAYHTSITSAGPTYSEHVLFSSEKFDILVNYRDSSKQTTFNRTAQNFPGTTDREIIGLLPLAPGKAWKLKMCNAGKRTAELDLYIKVMDKIKFELGGKEIDCYKIGYSYMRQPENDVFGWYLYLTEKNHEFVRLESKNFVETRIIE